MEQMKDKPTQAFEKYIDHISLIQNGVFAYARKWYDVLKLAKTSKF